MRKLIGYIFLIKDDDLLNKYNTIQDKISADAKTELNNKPVYNKKIVKTKKNFMVMKLQIFIIKKRLKQTLVMLVQQ